MALLVTPEAGNASRVTCSCGLVDCLVHDVALGVLAEAVELVEAEHSC